MNGVARTTFLRNRIGFCVLHPPGCAGLACVVEKDDGTREQSAFPEAIAPVAPFVDMRAIAYSVVPGVDVELRFTGDLFEMEDQRNWTDASFKTFCTPLRLPFPVEITAGTRVAQSVTLALHGADAPQPNAGASVPLTFTVDTRHAAPLPELGLGVASDGVSPSQMEQERLRRLNLTHLRVDLRLDDLVAAMAELQRATGEARALGVRLDIALHLSGDAEEELRGLSACLRMCVHRCAAGSSFTSRRSRPRHIGSKLRVNICAPTSRRLSSAPARMLILRN